MKVSLIVLAGLLSLPTLVTTIGCSPAADPIGKGSAHFGIEFSPTAPPNQSCGLPSIGGLGSPEPPEMPIGTDAGPDIGQIVADGQAVGDTGTGSYVVKCTVTSGGKITIEMEGPNTSPSASATNKGTTAIDVEGSINKETGEGTARITARTPFSGATASSDCELYAAEGSSVSAGKAHFAFVCEQATTSLDQFGICQTRGVVYVKDCLDE